VKLDEMTNFSLSKTRKAAPLALLRDEPAAKMLTLVFEEVTRGYGGCFLKRETERV
jgi:hypothetical protein